MSVVFHDEFGVIRQTCGDLEFSDEAGTIRAIWNPQHDTQNSTWFRKFRMASSGIADSMLMIYDELVTSADTADTTFAAMLWSAADAVSFRLFISSSRPTTPAAFDQGCEEACVQHWRRIDPPALDSTRIVNDSTVRLVWRNRNAGRLIDSTALIRNGVLYRVFGPATSVLIDGPLSVGPYSYKLRHFTAPSPNTILLATPNSAFSQDTTLTIGPPPPTGLLCEGNFAATIDCRWTNTTPTDSTVAYRNAGARDTLAAGVSIWTDPVVVRGTSYTYQLAHLRGTFQGALGSPILTVANPVPPNTLACVASGIGSARCTWTNGEPLDSVQLQRQTNGAWFQLPKLAPGVTLFDNAGLRGGVTYTYRARHVKGSDSSASSASAQVAMASPPPPTGLACQGNFNTWMDCTWTNTDPSDSTYVYRNGAFRAAVGPGQTGWTDDPVTYNSAYAYTVRHVDSLVQGPLSLPDSEVANAEAPINLSCGGTGLTTATCVWMHAEGDTLIVERKTIKAFAYRATIPPPNGASGQFLDSGLTTGATYTYRVFYRRGGLAGRYSNEDTARPDSIAEPYRPGQP